MSVASVVARGLITLLACGSAWASGSGLEVQSRALQRASDAVVGLTAKAVEDARSSATLGAVRLGSGVVIGDEGSC